MITIARVDYSLPMNIYEESMVVFDRDFNYWRFDKVRNERLEIIYKSKTNTPINMVHSILGCHRINFIGESVIVYDNIFNSKQSIMDYLLEMYLKEKKYIEVNKVNDEFVLKRNWIYMMYNNGIRLLYFSTQNKIECRWAK